VLRQELETIAKGELGDVRFSSVTGLSPAFVTVASAFFEIPTVVEIAGTTGLIDKMPCFLAFPRRSICNRAAVLPD
jgi:hypothetical protein